MNDEIITATISIGFNVAFIENRPIISVTKQNIKKGTENRKPILYFSSEVMADIVLFRKGKLKINVI